MEILGSLEDKGGEYNRGSLLRMMLFMEFNKMYSVVMFNSNCIGYMVGIYKINVFSFFRLVY